MAQWSERRAFQTILDERLFGAWSRHGPSEPPVALCGVDNALARAVLEDAEFKLVIETGLGGGPQSFKNFSLHTFPSSVKASRLWLSAESNELPQNFRLGAIAVARARQVWDHTACISDDWTAVRWFAGCSIRSF